MSGRTIENPVIGDKVTFVRRTRETGGCVTEILVELSPGGGNEPHYHTSVEETFTALEGPLGIVVGSEQRLLGPGESVTVPPGTVHRFYNPSDRPVRFKGEVRPGRSGMERFIEIAYGLAADGHVIEKGYPNRLSHVALLMEMGDMRMPGVIFALATPLLHWLARRARQRGTEAALIDRYCE